ncbi:hypothetical protein Taro_026837, partial [Colocasia esculenta]|nr:hypothetical protein [Colocasia esculenta]
MAAVTYGPQVIACHAKCGYLAVPLVFGDFPAVVGSPYFLGVVPAVQATPKAASKATAVRGTKPRPSQGRVFSVNTISCVAISRKQGQRQGRRGSKPRTVVSNSGKTVLVGDIRVRLDGGEPILPRDRSVPTVATSNQFAPLQGMRQEDRDSPKGARQGQASSSAPQLPRKMRQMWVTKQEARRIKQARADQLAESPKEATVLGQEKDQETEPPRPRGHKRRGIYRKPNFVHLIFIYLNDAQPLLFLFLSVFPFPFAVRPLPDLVCAKQGREEEAARQGWCGGKAAKEAAVSSSSGSGLEQGWSQQRRAAAAAAQQAAGEGPAATAGASPSPLFSPPLLPPAAGKPGRRRRLGKEQGVPAVVTPSRGDAGSNKGGQRRLPLVVGDG